MCVLLSLLVVTVIAFGRWGVCGVAQGVFLKEERHGVAMSHKSRHLFNVLLCVANAFEKIKTINTVENMSRTAQCHHRERDELTPVVREAGPWLLLSISRRALRSRRCLFFDVVHAAVWTRVVVIVVMPAVVVGGGVVDRYLKVLLETSETAGSVSYTHLTLRRRG